MNAPLRFLVVIPVFNQAHLTERCLRSLFTHSSLVSEVVVVDNASFDETPQLLSLLKEEAVSLQIKFEIMRNPENKGFGRACNQGIRELKLRERRSESVRVVILNNDTWLMKDWDLALARVQDRFSFDLIGPYFYEGEFEESQILAKAKVFTAENRKQIRKHFMPILMCFTNEAILKLDIANGGIFDERFFVTYEDTDLKERMDRLGMSYAQTGACMIWHHSMGTRKAKDPSGKNLLPSGYEQEGLRLFIEKWGFDPRPRDHTVLAKLKRFYRKYKEKQGRF